MYIYTWIYAIMFWLHQFSKYINIIHRIGRYLFVPLWIVTPRAIHNTNSGFHKSVAVWNEGRHCFSNEMLWWERRGLYLLYCQKKVEKTLPLPPPQIDRIVVERGWKRSKRFTYVDEIPFKTFSFMVKYYSKHRSEF